MVRYNYLKKNASYTLLILSIFFSSFSSRAQFLIDSQDPMTPGFLNKIVQTLVGDGVYVVPGSISITGSPKQIGIYSINGPTGNIPFRNGLILSTSEAKNIAGPDNSIQVLSDQIPPESGDDPGDALLNQFTVNETKDAIGLQFTFRPKSSQVIFRYGIGSEEYPDFVIDDEFNDVFGFFVTGPKPGGGAYNDQNIAILPNSQLAGVYNIFNNPLYMNDMQGNLVHQFNAVSIAFACTLNVIPCSDYTIKLKICDVSDESYDSAVFLEANRFGVPPLSLVAITESNDLNTMEGCSPIKIVASKNDSKIINQEIIIPLTIGGSAISGKDYTGLPNSIKIPSGKSTDTLVVSIIEDYINEPEETIRIIYPASCGFFDTLVLKIKPKPDLILTPGPSPSKCAGSGSVQISAKAAGGMPPYSYSWSNGASGSTITVNPDSTTDYSVIVTDRCGGKDTAKVTVVIFTDNLVPQIISNSPVCAGADLILETSAGADKYYWSGPNGWTASGNKVVRTGITRADSGSYSLQIEKNGCKSDINKIKVLVFDSGFLPPILSNSPVCENNELKLVGLAGQGSVCIWSGPNGFTSSIPNPLIKNMKISQAGEYSFKVIAGACTSGTSKLMVTVNPSPKALAGDDKQICSKDTIQIGELPETGVTYAWTPSSGLSNPNISNPFLSLSNSGINNVSQPYIIKAFKDGCTNWDTMLLRIISIPVPDFEIPKPQCFNGHSFDFFIKNPVPNSAGFAWSFGSSAIPASSLLKDPKGIRFQTPGKYPVTLQIFNQGCESQKITREVNVLEAPKADFEALPLSGCSPLQVSFNNKSQGGQGSVSYAWDFGNGVKSTSQNPQIIFGNQGVYDVSLIVVKDLICADTLIRKGYINVLPKPISLFSISSKTIEFDNPKTQINNLATNSTGDCKYTITNYLGEKEILDFCDGTYIFTDTGKYQIKQIVKNDEGCIDSSFQILRVVPAFRIYIPSSFTPSEPDNLNDFFRVYGEGMKDFFIQIYDRWGHLIYQSYDPENGWDGRVMLGEQIVPGDMYYYKVKVSDVFNFTRYYDGWVYTSR